MSHRFLRRPTFAADNFAAAVTFGGLPLTPAEHQDVRAKAVKHKQSFDTDSIYARAEYRQGKWPREPGKVIPFNKQSDNSNDAPRR